MEDRLERMRVILEMLVMAEDDVRRRRIGVRTPLELLDRPGTRRDCAQAELATQNSHQQSACMPTGAGSNMI